MNKNRSRIYNRDVSIRKAIRKRRISQVVYPRGYEYPFYNNLHQYSKNKVHCSCSYCSAKTRNKGHRRYKSGNYNASLNYKASDIRNIERMDVDEKEMQFEQYESENYKVI